MTFGWNAVQNVVRRRCGAVRCFSPATAVVSVSAGLLGAFALGADDVVRLQEEAFADERSVAFVARETAAVPVTALE